jgi:hypothetical protein
LDERRHRTDAEFNDVELYDQEKLGTRLEQHPLTLLDVERFLYTNGSKHDLDQEQSRVRR